MVPICWLGNVRDMKATQKLPKTYRPGEEFNLQNLKTVLGLNAAGLVGLVVFGWLFLQFAFRVRPEIVTAGLRSILGSMSILSFAVTLVVTMVVHELVHGFFFWLYTRDRPKFGFNLLYAYAAAPGWYFPRNQFIWVGLAPLVVLSLVGLLLLPAVPFSWVPLLVLGLILNAAGAVGDLWVVAWLAGRPRESFLQDRGPTMQIFLPQLPHLKEKWLALLGSFHVPVQEAEAAFDRLVEQYQSGRRHYHTLLHIQETIAQVDNLSAFAAAPHVVTLASWYHDVIYDAGRNDNETLSAQFAARELAALNIPAKVVAEVQRLILLTAGYHLPTWEQAGREDYNAHVLLDADLAGLSTPWEIYAHNGENIRSEFAEIPHDAFIRGRIALLEKFLARERIYYTPPMFAQSERAARENIKRELAELKRELPIPAGV